MLTLAEPKGAIFLQLPSKGFLLDLAVQYLRIPRVIPHSTSGHTHESVILDLFYFVNPHFVYYPQVL